MADGLMVRLKNINRLIASQTNLITALTDEYPFRGTHGHFYLEDRPAPQCIQNHDRAEVQLDEFLDNVQA